MNRLEAITALRDKVKAGDFDVKPPRTATWSANQHFKFYKLAEDGGIPAGACGDAASAFKGSLDAAKALHEAVLPGCHFQINVPGAVLTEDMNGMFHSATADNPARAWLLAILEALIQMETEE